MIFETHAHYEDEQFDGDRELLLEQIREQGISPIVNVGSSLETTKKSIQLAKQYAFLYAAIGIHPSEIADLNEGTIKWLYDHASEPKVVAIGEIGLDYYWPKREYEEEIRSMENSQGKSERLLNEKDKRKRLLNEKDKREWLLNEKDKRKWLLEEENEKKSQSTEEEAKRRLLLEEQKAKRKLLLAEELSKQQYWFGRQLDLARETGLPVIIHSRDAAEDTYEIMASHHAEEIGGVVHCFSYHLEMARKFVKMGFYIGVGGVVTFKNAKKLKEVVKELPLEHIVLETDCPYMAPEPFRGKRNSSLYLPYVVKKIAELKEVSEEEVIAVTEQNARKMYRL